MCVWAIIPVKPLNRAKSRLAAVLTEDQRTEFAETMLRQVLDTVTSAHKVIGTLVISRDSRALAIARDYGAKTVQESGSPELNAALMRATEVVRTWGCEAVFVLPADLPFVAVEDVLAMIELGQDDPSMVIATDREGDGTNGLLIRPAGLIEYAYGPGSFERHMAEARAIGVEPKVYQSERMMLDIDLPEHLDEYNRIVADGDFKLLHTLMPEVRRLPHG